MSSVRDNASQVGNNLLPVATDASDSAVQAHGTQVTSPTEAQLDHRRAIREQDFQTRKQQFQTDFLKKLSDPPGYGANETDDSKHVKSMMGQAGFDVPTANQVQVMNAAVGQLPEFQNFKNTVADAVNGNGKVPTSGQLSDGLNSILAAGFPSKQASVGSTGSAAELSTDAQANNAQSQTKSDVNALVSGTSDQNDTAAPAQSAPIINSPIAAPAGQTDAAASSSELPATTSVSALVFLVILQSQQETVKEKNDVLMKIKMFNGMLDKLNDMVNSTLIPAQKEMENLKNAGKDKKNFKPENIQVPVNWPTDIDTNNASMDASTGDLVLNAQWGDGTNSSRQLVDSTGLANLISTADQWRTSIQNNQTQQSNRFQAKDNQMSSAWNILNAVLKNTHDGVSSIVRNI